MKCIIHECMGEKGMADQFLMKYAQVQQAVIEKTSAATYNSAYELTYKNVMSCWFFVFLIGTAFALMSVIAMEFIDNDKR